MLIEVLKIVLICVVSLGVFILFSFIIIGYFTYYKSTRLIKDKEVKKLVDRFYQKSKKSIENISKEYKIEKIRIKSTKGKHYIPANYIYNKGSNTMNDNTVIMIHGLGGNRYSNYPIAEMFLKLGYNVLTYDQRSSNENKAKYTTFGYLEKYDAMDYIRYIKSLSPNKKLMLWGTSFGGATAALAACESNNRIDYLILDCPVSSMSWIIKDKYKKNKLGFLTKYVLFFSNLFTKINLGFEYDDVEISIKSKNIVIPTLIINSKIDNTTPYFMSRQIYNNIKCENKIIYTVNDSYHSEIYFDHKDSYKKNIENLVNNKK